MKIKKINQSGSHVVAVVLVLCVLGLVVFTGIRILGHDHVGLNNKTEAQSVTIVPAGFKLFSDKSIGAQFIYPEVYGEFSSPKEKVSAEYESALATPRLATDYLPGVSGQFLLGTYKSASPEITTRRYGPKVKLSGSDWVVTEPNQYDTSTYHKGDAYPDISRTNVRGIDVYTSKAGDEGITVYSLYFLTQGKLHVLQLPPFNSDLGTSSYNVNDQSSYDTLLQQIRGSIALY